MKHKKGNRIFGFLGSASGGGAIASLHNICHVLCVGLASSLALFGIIISDTALMFLQSYNVYFWLMGLFFLLISIALMTMNKLVSIKLMIFNTGLLIASIPFAQDVALLATGSAISAAVVIFYLKEKMEVIQWKRK